MPRKPRPRRRVGVLPGLLVALSPVSQLGFTPVSVVLGERLDLSVGQVGLTVGVYAAAAAVATAVLGPVVDLVAPRRVLPVAVTANVLLSAALLLEPGYAGILLARVLSGVANSALVLCAAVVVADAHRDDPGGRDRGFSVLQTFTSLGAVAGLGLGAAAAGLGAPEVWSWTVVAYGLLVLALTPLTVRRMPPVRSHVGGPAARAGLRTVVREASVALRVPRTAALLLAAAGVGWAIQATHYAVSLLAQELDPPLAQRVALSVMIPAGVFLGASANQVVLGRRSAEDLFRRAYPVLPVACALLALVVGGRGNGAVALLLALLVGLGTVLGVLMPLSPAVLVGRHPDLRGSVTAADSVAKGLGSTVSPVVLGAVAAASSLGGGFLLLAGVVALAAVCARAQRATV
ncbi:MFS transporter [Kineococcus sp. TBRC 1896]|uniref:MFS transporter n=1 Tax=Kineococcus mangrovi TaxID=1660183 RepID=A0ABV4I080_9ACTN